MNTAPFPLQRDGLRSARGGAMGAREQRHGRGGREGRAACCGALQPRSGRRCGREPAALSLSPASSPSLSPRCHSPSGPCPLTAAAPLRGGAPLRAAPAGLCAGGARCDVIARRRRGRSAAMADMADLFGSDADSEPEHKGLGRFSLFLSLSPPPHGVPPPRDAPPAPPLPRSPSAGGREGAGRAARRGRCLQGRVFGCSRVLQTVEHLVCVPDIFKILVRVPVNYFSRQAFF